MESAITAKGQATIPKAAREHLQLRPGDQIKFSCIPTAVSFSYRNARSRACEASSRHSGGQ